MATPVPPTRPWVKFYEPGIPADVDIPNSRIPDLVQKSVERVGNRPALIFYGEKWSYLRLWAESGRFAAALRREGLKQGDRVALYLPNVPEYPIAYLGALRAGLTVVQVSPLFLGDDLATLLEYSQPSAIVTLEILYPNLMKIQGRIPTPLAFVGQLREFYPGLARPFVNRVLRKRGMSTEVPTGAHIRSWGSVMESPGQVPGLTTDPAQEVAVLQYTGGTTGIPKAAMLSHRNLVANAMQCRAWFGNRSTGHDVVLASVPMFHIYGLTVALNYPLFEGATIILQTRPDIPEILKLVNRYHPTHFPGVPALYQGFSQHPKVGRYRLRSIRVCVSGSAPLPAEVQKRFEELTGARLVEGYGLSETSPVTHCNPLAGERRVGSIGVPVSNTDQRIVDLETGTRELPIGEEGELAVRGPQVMLGYYRQPDETAAVLRDGWFRTGDIARLDADGFAYIVDRKKDLINVGGFKVWPREVEEVLYQHPAVAEAAVVGSPDPELGEVPRAFVVRKPGTTVTGAELIAFVRGRIAHYKAPRAIEFRDTLPRSGVQKVLRRVLRETPVPAPAPVTVPAQ